MANTYKKLPYGVSDFETVRTRNLYYVDKTMYLPRLEEFSDFVFFIRPRRFGKSLFISMMCAYYDKARREDFDTLFAGTWIGSHPTALRGHFQVLLLDFSRIESGAGALRDSFNRYCCARIEDFINTYAADYPAETVGRIRASDNAFERLNILHDTASRLRLPLYLIIDEYDNFTNVILNEEGEDVYHALTHADGLYRNVFKLFKGMFERIFLIGVSPVTLDDLTSGFNIALNASLQPAFNEMLGFSTAEVHEMLRYFKESGQLPPETDTEALVAEMKPWYDNYCFAKACIHCDQRVFNSDMVLYYLKHRLLNGCAPEQMTDPNTRTDYAKMKRLLRLDTLEGERRNVIRRIAEEGRIMADIAPSFSAAQLADPDTFVSLLFYYGMLTLSDTVGVSPVLAIPNNNVRKQYYTYLLETFQTAHAVSLNELSARLTYMAIDGRWADALRFIADSYEAHSSVRDAIEGERNLQGFFLAYLSLSPYYLTAPELELAHGYCDLFLIPDRTRYDTRHAYVIELKYLPRTATAAQARAQWDEACAQIQRYVQAPRLRQLCSGLHLHPLILQFQGWKLNRMEEIK